MTDAETPPTYYGRQQLKPAPFNKALVGGYIFLAGLSGAAALISGLAALRGGQDATPIVRRGRYLSLLAPTLGSLFLIYDLHTPKRFYNMLRVAKSTSPMSIGSWTLVGFGMAAGMSAAAQFAADWIFPRFRPLRRLASLLHFPAALAGAGLSTYTAALLAATSTPGWAAAPKALGVRFAASAMASGAAALSLGERSPGLQRALGSLSTLALLTELVATSAGRSAYRRKGIDALESGAWSRAEKLGGTGIGVLAPLAAAALRRSEGLPPLVALAILAGSAIMRVSVLGVGADSASRPAISFRFAQPENLPKA